MLEPRLPQPCRVWHNPFTPSKHESRPHLGSLRHAEPADIHVARFIEVRPYDQAVTNTNSYRARMSFAEFEMQSITGDQVNFSQFQGQVSLVVNVASA
jgi:hypothetical protein